MKYLKDTLITAVVVLGGILAVMGYHFSEVAKTPFWWNTWMVLGIVAWVVLLGGWFFLWTRDRKQGKKGR